MRVTTQLTAGWLPHALLGPVVLAGLTGIPNVYTAMRHNGSAAVTEAMNSNILNIMAGLAIPAVLLGSSAFQVLIAVYIGFLATRFYTALSNSTAAVDRIAPRPRIGAPFMMLMEQHMHRIIWSQLCHVAQMRSESENTRNLNNDFSGVDGTVSERLRWPHGIVNKQRSQYGETKGEKQKDREGKSPDRGLPVDNYQHLTISQIAGKLNGLSKGDLRKVEKYEKSHKNRKGALAEIEKRLKS